MRVKIELSTDDIKRIKNGEELEVPIDYQLINKTTVSKVVLVKENAGKQNK